MAENKTKQTDASVGAYLAAIDDPARRADCQALTTLMTKVSGQPPAMWGSSIVGFGSYHYRYASGREGDACLVGFSSRKGDIAVYGLRSCPDAEGLLAQLGKHLAGKGCLYIKKMADIDPAVLAKLIAGAVKAGKGGC